jgi:HK97 gp10 family phage protein
MAYIPEKLTFNLEGFDEFEQQLLEMAKDFRSDTIARKTLVPAAKVAMQTVYESAVSRAPVGDKPRDEYNPFHMRDTMRLDARIPSEKDRQSEYVNRTDAAIAVVSVKKSAVSLAQEFGTSKIGAKPFLRISLQQNATSVLDTLKSELSGRITDYAARLNRRKK